MIKINTLLNLFNAKDLWSIGLYEANLDFSFQEKMKNPMKVFNSKKIRTKSKHIHTWADPFLFLFNGELYLFFESVSHGEHGVIEAIKTSNFKIFVSLGTVLKTPFHLSYPFVFPCNSSIFMIPESVHANEIALYKFADFPNGLFKSRVLLEGAYFDSSVIEHNGIWFLFTTSKNGLEIFFSDDIENGNLMAHPSNPITTDQRYCRCGGTPIIINNDLFRLAQDCSTEYGKNINMFKINKLTETEYDEELMIEDYFDNLDNWNSLGGHHLSCIEFNGAKIIAVDGKQPDYLINNFLPLPYLIYKKLKRLFVNRE